MQAAGDYDRVAGDKVGYWYFPVNAAFPSQYYSASIALLNSAGAAKNMSSMINTRK